MRILLAVMLLSMSGCMPGCPGYVFVQEQAGEGSYAQAQQDRKIKVLEAQAELDAAKLKAEAEVARADGV
ncbi:MAG: hypothetical protein ACYC6M_04915, partial [Terriglobales bacterium]